MSVAMNELIEKGKFLMVSYRSIDSHIVVEDIHSMQALGLRVWYDAAMELGDNWKHVAESIIKHPNCAGVIFYNSENSFLSKPVFYERAWAREELAHKHEIGEPYVYFSVNIGGRTTHEIIRDTYRMAGAGNLETFFPFDYLRDVVNMFNEDVLCIRRTGTSQETAAAIYKKTRNLGVVDDEEIMLERWCKAGVMSTEENNKVVYCGYYPRTLVDVDVSPRNIGKKWFKERNVHYCYQDGHYYTCSPVRFVYIGMDGEDLVFMADSVLFVSTAEELAASLALFGEEAFVEEKKVAPVGTAFVPDEAVFLAVADKMGARVKTSDFAEGTYRYWLSDRGTGGKALQMNVNETGHVNRRGFNKKYTLGVRPCIKLKIKKKE